MENLKHTPGPWIFQGPIQDTTGTCDIITEDKIISRVTAYEFYNCTILESNANAKLIAAAPELLEALIELDKLVFSLNINVDGLTALALHACRERVHKSINKAIGHEQNSN